MYYLPAGWQTLYNPAKGRLYTGDFRQFFPIAWVNRAECTALKYVKTAGSPCRKYTAPILSHFPHFYKPQNRNFITKSGKSKDISKNIQIDTNNSHFPPPHQSHPPTAAPPTCHPEPKAKDLAQKGSDKEARCISSFGCASPVTGEAFRLWWCENT